MYSRNDYRELEREVASLVYQADMTVSVVVPFYKGANELARTLAALANQSYPKKLFEVIIAVDGTSSELPKALCRRWLPPMLHWNVVRIERKGYRLATNRNNGIRSATGSLVVLVDFDIITRPDFLDSHVRYHRLSEALVTFGLRDFVDCSEIDPAFVASGLIDWSSLPKVSSISNRRRAIDPRIPELAWIHEHPAPYNLGHGFNLGFRREDAIQGGLFNEVFNGASNYEDIEFCYRMWQRRCRMVHVPQVRVLHQENAIVTEAERTKGMSVNREKLYNLVPGLREYRKHNRVGEWSESTPENQLREV